MKTECTECGIKTKLEPSFNNDLKTFLTPYSIHQKYRSFFKLLTWLWLILAILSFVFLILTMRIEQKYNRFLFFLPCLAVFSLSIWKWLLSYHKFPGGVGFLPLTIKEVLDLRWHQEHNGTWTVLVKRETGRRIKFTHIQDIDAFIMAKNQAYDFLEKEGDNIDTSIS